MKRLLLPLLLCGSLSLAGQVLDKNITAQKGTPVLDFLRSLENEQSIKIFYVPSWFENITIQKDYHGRTINEVLRDALEGLEISYVSLFGYEIIFFKDPRRDIQQAAVIESAQERNIKIEQAHFGDKNNFVAGKKFVLKGTVLDEKTNAPLPGVAVVVHGNERPVTTDASGSFNYSLNAGQYIVGFRYSNYDEKLINVNLYGDGQLKVVLSEIPIVLQEVVVTDEAITTARISQSTLKMTDLKRTPSFLGIPDIVKQIQTLSGVSTVSEASSGFNVRGGGADQNLILFDGVPIFNTSHALGFFTAFNAEAISRAGFYKGGIPAEYGGRVSSVLNITAKEGNYQKWQGSGGIGLVTSDLTVGGPLKKDTSALIFSLRSSYSDWILNLLQTRYPDIQKGSVFFYDGSAKYSYKPDKSSRLFVTAYFSSDKFQLANDTTNQWRNKAFAARYDRTISNDLSFSTALSFGNYTYTVTEEDRIAAFNLKYQIHYPSLKIDFNQEGVKHKRSFGLHATYYIFSPGELHPVGSESKIVAQSIPRERALESAVYFSDAFEITPSLRVEAGLRLSLLNRVGANEIFKYLPNEPRETATIVDSVQFSNGEFIKTYLGPEPRVNFQYLLNTSSSLKLGISRMYQYVHLVSNTAAITPVDIWQLSNQYFKPQRADQISLGYYKGWKDNLFEGFIEVYYKDLRNVLDFKDGANLILNRQIETTLLSGLGKSFGLEFSIMKNRGKITGGINYTLSRSLRKFDGDFDVEEINNGGWYASNFDQPHIVNANWRVSFTKRIFFTGLFTFHSGRPISLPSVGYMIDGVPVTDFTERNNNRVPAYHRLDVAFVVEGSPRKKKKFEGHWVFSIYNVYGRKNPYSVFFVNEGGATLRPYQLSLIGTAVPSLTYTFKF